MVSRSDVAWVSAQFALFALIAVFVFATSGSGPAGAPWVGAAATGAGLGLAGWALARLGPSVSPFPTPTQGAILVMSGPYRLVRHPIYGGVILTALGLSVISWSLPAIVLSLGLVPFFFAKSSHEEELLVARFAGYADYVAATSKRLIPWVI